MPVRSAHQTDYTPIANLMYLDSRTVLSESKLPKVHRHLDWRGPLEWLGAEEYWVFEQNGTIIAALACPPDPEGIAWLRLFAHAPKNLDPARSAPIQDTWKALWEKADIKLHASNLLVAAITSADWFSSLLLESGFSATQQIVVLHKNSNSIRPNANPREQRPILNDLLIRSMTELDLPAVTAVDTSGFPPLWRNSHQALLSGFIQAGFATVAELDGEIVGYQISTVNSYGVHLARLAVTQHMQARGIGTILVQDLILQSQREGFQRITVNTQSDNRASLALYHKIGFELTGDRYTVFTYQQPAHNPIS